jgi:hypothetical protein
MLPELPNANYSVWVRGYGLVDSAKKEMRPGTTPVTLEASVARTPQEAAKIYPGDYWLSMIEPTQKTSAWMQAFKSNCNFCHQLGNGITRTLDHVFAAMPNFKTSVEAWDHRLRTGVRGGNMYGSLSGIGGQAAVAMLADWTDRIGKGEVPAVAPKRPSGIEANLVLTLWDWGTDHSFMHDQVTTNKQNPRINANGPLYAVSAGHGTLVVLDPNKHETFELAIPLRLTNQQVNSRFPQPNPPSLWWGSEWLWGPTYHHADPHNPMLDTKGRVWLTSKIRANQAGSFCNDPQQSKYAAYLGRTGGGRQASFYDPKTKEFNLIETCYATHHLQFDNDPNETVYFNELSGPIFGWVDSKVYDETYAKAYAANDKNKAKAEAAAEVASVGWCPQVLDSNGDGKVSPPIRNAQGQITNWNVAARGVDPAVYQTDTVGGGDAPAPTPRGGGAAAPRGGAPGGAPGGGRGRGGPGGGGQQAAAFDVNLDTQVSFSLYSVIPSPVDTSVWGVAENPSPGMLVRLIRGDNPPETCKTQIFKVPEGGLDPRGVDIDTNGVVWTALAASSHLASFDVRKCNLSGRANTNGTWCQEGWTLYQTTGPKFKNSPYPTDFHYFNWVDQFNTSGVFGPNTPIATGSNSDSLLALDPATGKWTTLRVPYPLGFYSRGLDGRIDDPNTGWKGRALYSNYGTHFVWHMEGGKGTRGKEIKFQLRPDPMAR